MARGISKDIEWLVKEAIRTRATAVRPGERHPRLLALSEKCPSPAWLGRLEICRYLEEARRHQRLAHTVNALLVNFVG